MTRTTCLALLLLAGPALANGDGPDLSALYADATLDQPICYAAEAEPDGAERTVTQLQLSLVPYGESYNGTANDNGFAFTLDLGLSGTPDEMRIYGCCDQAGYCGTGEACADQPVFLRMAEEGLEVDLSAYPKRGPSATLTPEAERPTIGAQDARFMLAPAACPKP
ncbi:hypothetical protein C8N43_1617 [Litoreibacter ponti]|uniref:Uncharacterized protein n=1 Tax=Litoreibacter ponti TaxID=1510457 RepID=A0A2T6BLM4_9RHOB|nr:hypothetical protein [Litoreibacter ponti]PTX56952.1 hypothetical protein C8N43_1617 [Litoreibacter ponti]